MVQGGTLTNVQIATVWVLAIGRATSRSINKQWTVRLFLRMLRLDCAEWTLVELYQVGIVL
jgi:hypothetical protein